MLLKGIINDGADTCIVSFTGVGHTMAGLNVQKEEFVGREVGPIKFARINSLRFFLDSVILKILSP